MVGCESSASHRIHPCGSHETCNAAISRAMCKVNYANCLMQAAWLCIQALAPPFRVDIPRELLRCDKTALLRLLSKGTWSLGLCRPMPCQIQPHHIWLFSGEYMHHMNSYDTSSTGRAGLVGKVSSLEVLYARNSVHHTLPFTPEASYYTRKPLHQKVFTPVTLLHHQYSCTRFKSLLPQ